MVGGGDADSVDFGISDDVAEIGFGTAFGELGLFVFLLRASHRVNLLHV